MSLLLFLLVQQAPTSSCAGNSVVGMAEIRLTFDHEVCMDCLKRYLTLIADALQRQDRREIYWSWHIPGHRFATQMFRIYGRAAACVEKESEESLRAALGATHFSIQFREAEPAGEGQTFLPNLDNAQLARFEQILNDFLQAEPWRKEAETQ